MNEKKFNKYFDHTLLKPEATPEQIDELCKEAISADFYSVCVNSCYVPQVFKALSESDVKTCSVVGFPLGACSTEVKAFETKYACENGASEVDMVINVGMLKSMNYEFVQNDIAEVVKAAHSLNALVKVIIETCYSQTMRLSWLVSSLRQLVRILLKHQLDSVAAVLRLPMLS